MKRKKEKEKKVYHDDGHTVYDMSGLRRFGEGNGKKESAGLEKKERRAAIRAALRVYLPILLLVILCFFGAMWLIRLWLHV